MLGVTSGSELLWNRRNQAAKKENAMWIQIQLPFNKNYLKISIKKPTLDLPWNYLKLSKNKLSSLKI